MKEKLYMDVAFTYEGILYVERVNLNEICLDDRDYWSWLTSAKSDDFNPDLVFDIIGKKDMFNNVTTEGMIIEVFESEDALDPIHIIEDVFVRKSGDDALGFEVV